MTRYQLTTLIAFCVTVVSITVLSVLKLNVPAAITGALGSLITSLLPSLIPQVSVAAAAASMRPPAMPSEAPKP